MRKIFSYVAKLFVDYIALKLAQSFKKSNITSATKFLSSYE